MHPEVCRFVSEAFYEGRLGSIPECAERTTSDGVGVRWLDVAITGTASTRRRRLRRSRRRSSASWGILSGRVRSSVCSDTAT